MSVKNNSGDTPVHLAALKGQLKMLRFLQKKGADLAEKGWGGCTALHDAAAEGHTDVVRLILKINSDKKFIDLADNGEMTALGSSVTRDSKVSTYLSIYITNYFLIIINYLKIKNLKI